MVLMMDLWRAKRCGPDSAMFGAAVVDVAFFDFDLSFFSGLGATRTLAVLRYFTGSVWCLRPNTKSPTATQVSGEALDESTLAGLLADCVGNGRHHLATLDHPEEGMVIGCTHCHRYWRTHADRDRR